MSNGGYDAAHIAVAAGRDIRDEPNRDSRRLALLFQGHKDLPAATVTIRYSCQDEFLYTTFIELCVSQIWFVNYCWLPWTI